PRETGHGISLMGWLPLVNATWKWEQPEGVNVAIRSRWGRLVEEITAQQRTIRTHIVRRLTVTDIFGLARFAVRRRQQQDLTVSPARGQLGPQRLIPQYDHGDQLGH